MRNLPYTIDTYVFTNRATTENACRAIDSSRNAERAAFRFLGVELRGRQSWVFRFQVPMILHNAVVVTFDTVIVSRLGADRESVPGETMMMMLLYWGLAIWDSWQGVSWTTVFVAPQTLFFGTEARNQPFTHTK